jgi:hypothetical protein
LLEFLHKPVVLPQLPQFPLPLSGIEMADLLTHPGKGLAPGNMLEKESLYDLVGDDPQRLPSPGWVRLSLAAGRMGKFLDEVAEVKVAAAVIEEKETGNETFPPPHRF